LSPSLLRWSSSVPRRTPGEEAYAQEVSAIAGEEGSKKKLEKQQ
jgi:hypothetical protein